VGWDACPTGVRSGLASDGNKSEVQLIDGQRVAPWRTAVALSTQRCRMANPPAGRANQRPRAASRCIIAVFLQSRLPVESVSCASGKMQPGCFLRCSTRSKQRAPRLCACPSGVPYAGIPHGAMGVTGRAAALNGRPRRVGRWLAVLWWCGRDGVAFCDVAVPPSRQRRRRATGAGERGNIVISHTTQQHGVVGGRDISKHPLNGSSGPGTGSASRGQLSRLSIGRIGLQIPGGVGSLNGKWERVPSRRPQRVSRGGCCLVERDTAADSALAAAHTHCAPRRPLPAHDSQRPSRGSQHRHRLVRSRGGRKGYYR
jgi:hypothetical protein